MMARPKNQNLATYQLCFILLSTVSLASVVTYASASLCTIPSPEPKHVPVAGKGALALLQSLQLSVGYFVGGEEIHFAKEESDEWSSYVAHSFSLLPHSVQRTDDDTGLLHVGATLVLSGGRTRLLRGRAGRRRQSYLGGHTVTFYLAGYYSTSRGDLCMTGSGTYSEDDDSIQHLPDVFLKLRVPNPSNLSDPFVTGSLQGAGFKPISLVAYAEGDGYRYRDRESSPCVTPRPSSSPARGAFQALGGTNFSCARLREHLVSSFKLQYGGGHDVRASSTSPTFPWLHEPSMHVDQVQCTADGAVRAYVVFSNDTKRMMRDQVLSRRPRFTVKEAAVVAEGRWDSARNMLCLRACRVVRSGSELTSLTVQPQDCSIGMSLWFRGVWTIRDRSAVAGYLWNTSQGAGINAGDRAVYVSSINVDIHRSNFSDVNYRYNYTLVEKAKDHYLGSELSKCKKKTKASFIGGAKGNYTYRDFEFRFYPASAMSIGQGDAYPVSIDSVIVYGDRLAADDSFSRQPPVVNKDHELLSVSYEIRQYLPPAGWVRPTNGSWSYAVSLEEHQIMAEGVYDPKTGVLCMIGCRELNGSTDTDCQVLITVQFASLDSVAQRHGKGAISSLRNKTDGLYFQKVDFNLYGMYSGQVSESVSRMDMESVMLAISTTLPCVFTALQILHAKRNPEASAATSLTMLIVLAMGYVAPLLVTSSEALFVSRRTQWLPFQDYVPYELNQAMLRAPTLIALLLQLRLLQLAWSSRRKSSSAPTDQWQGKTWSAAERRALWVCLPLYLAGAALTVIVNVVNNRRAEDSLTVGPTPATLWQDLVSSAGLALDAFLLPQVAMNAFSAGAGVVRAVSPWFYVGGAVVRAMPHVYDAIRRQSHAPSVRPSYVYAGPRDDRFGLAWDVAVPCVTGLLAALLFLQQRRGGAVLPRSRKSGGYEMVSSF